MPALGLYQGKGYVVGGHWVMFRATPRPLYGVRVGCFRFGITKCNEGVPGARNPKLEAPSAAPDLWDKWRLVEVRASTGEVGLPPVVMRVRRQVCRPGFEVSCWM